MSLLRKINQFFCPHSNWTSVFEADARSITFESKLVEGLKVDVFEHTRICRACKKEWFMTAEMQIAEAGRLLAKLEYFKQNRSQNST